MSSPSVNCSRKRGLKRPSGPHATLAVAVFGLFVLSCTWVHGDEVWLTNGHQLTGKIVSIDRDQLVLEVPEGTLSLKRSLIDYVIRVPARESMLAECKRRLRGGFPGSALGYLRKEYTRDPECQDVLDIYRKCLVAEIENHLDVESSEAALKLWREVSTLPGDDPGVSRLRPMVIQEQGRLLKLEETVLQSIEAGLPTETLQHLKSLETRYPSASQSWILVFEEQSLLAAQQYLLQRDFKSLHEVLMELLKKSPHYWPHTRAAITLASIHGQGIPAEDALTILPNSPALHLALANLAVHSGHPLNMSSHLERVTELVGGEIVSSEITAHLMHQASNELQGMDIGGEDLHSVCEAWLSQFWSRYSFPGSPPEIPAIVEHPSQAALDKHLGSAGESIRFEMIGEYGTIQKAILHVVPDEPLLSQDDLPREIFRSLIATSLGVPRCPVWLEEGLASRSRGPVAKSRDDWLLQNALEEGRLPEIRDLIRMKSIRSDLLRAACGSIVDSLLESTPRALIPLHLIQIRDTGLEGFLRSSSEVDTLHELQQRWIGDLRNQGG